MDKLFFILLGVWALMFGIFHVTNIRIEWGNPAMGVCALALGVVCIVRAVR
jgi:hypothetical protein